MVKQKLKISVQMFLKRSCDVRMHFKSQKLLKQLNLLIIFSSQNFITQPDDSTTSLIPKTSNQPNIQPE